MQFLGHRFSNNSRSPHQLLNPSFFEANGLESGSKADMLRLIEKSAFGSQLVGRDFLQEFAGMLERLVKGSKI